MKIVLLFLAVLCLQSSPFAQSYSFQPTDEYIGEADLEAYNIFQVNLVNTSNDSLYLNWRLVENTLPETWEISLCDNVACYGGLPTMAEMDPFAAGDSAFIKLDINPGIQEGSGLLRFRIYQTGFPAEYETLTFYISTYPTQTFSPIPLKTRLWPNPVQDLLHFQNDAGLPLELLIYDQQGRLCEQAEVPANSNCTLNVCHLPNGLYEVVSRSSAGQSHTRLLISH